MKTYKEPTFTEHLRAIHEIRREIQTLWDHDQNDPTIKILDIEKNGERVCFLQDQILLRWRPLINEYQDRILSMIEAIERYSKLDFPGNIVSPSMGGKILLARELKNILDGETQNDN